MDYYSATKKNGILPFAAFTWMGVVGIILSTTSQRKILYAYHLYVKPKKFTN